MKAGKFSWVRQIAFVAGLCCGSAEFAGRGDEPAPLAPAIWPPNQAAVTPFAPAWNAGRGGHVERLLAELPPPWQMMWDKRVLYELRLRLAAEKGAAQRRQQPSQPRRSPWRSNYGDVAPLAVVPRHAEASPHDLDAYRAEIERLDALIAQGRASATDCFLHGLIHYESGRWSIALRDFEQAIRLSGNPSDQFYCLRGLARYGLGEYRAAWDDLNEAVRRSPNLRNLNNRGVIACACGQATRALPDFEAALAIRQWATKVSPVLINRALAMSDLGRHEEAAAELKSVIEASGDPDAVEPANAAAGLVYRRGGDFSRSGVSYDILIQKKRADDCVAHGQPTPAAIDRMPRDHSLLDEFAGEETAVDALIGRGIAHHELNQIVPAIEDYSQAIRLAPRRVDAYVNRAVAYVDRGDMDLAQRDLETALRLNPNDAFAVGNRGLLRIRQGQVALGQADLARCVELRKDLQPLVERIVAGSRTPQAAGGSKRPSPFTAATTPARRPYAAATPAEAVEWLAAAGKNEDVDATIEALASPLGPGFRDLRAAAAGMDVAMRRYVAARNARSGNFFNLANSPLAQQIERERRKHAAAHKFVVQEMKILGKEAVSTTRDSAFRLVIRTIKTNALGETKTPKEIFYAVREGSVWRLLPESSWLAANDAKEAELMMSYFQRQVARLQAMRAMTEEAAQAFVDGKPVDEVAMLAAWSRISEGVPWPGKTGDEPPTMSETIVTALNSMIWNPGAAQQGQDVSPEPSPGQTDPADPRPNAKPEAKRHSQPSPGRWGPSERPYQAAASGNPAQGIAYCFALPDPRGRLAGAPKLRLRPL